MIVVLSPESGDDVQAMKAGLLEIADIFVVNKAERPGADEFVLAMETMLHFHERDQWAVPVVKSEAVNNVGIEEIYKCTQRHRQYLSETGLLYQHRRRHLRDEFIAGVKEKFVCKLLDAIEQDSRLSGYISKVEKGEIDSYSVSEEIIKLIGS
jgi:LAO/AO transport system kinase